MRILGRERIARIKNNGPGPGTDAEEHKDLCWLANWARSELRRRERKAVKREQIGRNKYLTIPEARRLLEYVKGAADYDINNRRLWRSRAIVNELVVFLMCETGLRVSEMCELEIRVYERGDLVVDNSEAIKSGALELYGKGKKYGVVGLSDYLRDRLKRYLGIDQPGFECAVRTAGPLLLNENGKALRRGRVYEKIKATGRGARIRLNHKRSGTDLKPHMLRHTSGMCMFGATRDKEVTRNQLRHTSVDTTNIYARSQIGMLRKAVNAVHCAFFDSEKGDSGV